MIFVLLAIEFYWTHKTWQHEIKPVKIKQLKLKKLYPTIENNKIN